MTLFDDLRSFFASVIRHSVFLLTSSVLAAALVFWEHSTQRSIHLRAYSAVVAIAFLYATFRAWQDEKRRADKATREAESLRSADAGLITREMTDNEFWLLSLAQKYGMRRRNVADHVGAQSNAIWIGDEPISNPKSEWLYSLARATEERGHFHQEPGPGGRFYKIPPEIEASLVAYRRLGRLVVVPSEPLFHAITGHRMEIKT